MVTATDISVIFHSAVGVATPRKMCFMSIFLDSTLIVRYIFFTYFNNLELCRENTANRMEQMVSQL